MCSVPWRDSNAFSFRPNSDVISNDSLCLHFTVISRPKQIKWATFQQSPYKSVGQKTAKGGYTDGQLKLELSWYQTLASKLCLYIFFSHKVLKMKNNCCKKTSSGTIQTSILIQEIWPLDNPGTWHHQRRNVVERGEHTLMCMIKDYSGTYLKIKFTDKSFIINGNIP